MRNAVGTVFATLAAVAAWAALACLAAIPDAVRESSREPEDVVLLAAWFAITAVLVVLWSASAMQALGWLSRRSLATERLVAGVMSLLGIAIALVGSAGVTDRFLVPVGLLIVGSAVAYTRLGRGEQEPANPAWRPTQPSRRG